MKKFQLYNLLRENSKACKGPYINYVVSVGGVVQKTKEEAVMFQEKLLHPDTVQDHEITIVVDLVPHEYILVLLETLTYSWGTRSATIVIS